MGIGGWRDGVASTNVEERPDNRDKVLRKTSALD